MPDLGHDFGNADARQRGIERFGYCPDDVRVVNLGFTAKCLRAFANNREAVRTARSQEFDGDWRVTRGVLRAVSVATGLYVMRPQRN